MISTISIGSISRSIVVSIEGTASHHFVFFRSFSNKPSTKLESVGEEVSKRARKPFLTILRRKQLLDRVLGMAAGIGRADVRSK